MRNSILSGCTGEGIIRAAGRRELSEGFPEQVDYGRTNFRTGPVNKGLRIAVAEGTASGSIVLATLFLSGISGSTVVQVRTVHV